MKCCIYTVFALRFENLLARNWSMKIFKHEKEEKLAGPTGNFAGPAPFLVASGLGPALNAKTVYTVSYDNHWFISSLFVVFIVVWYQSILPIFIRVTSLALEQSYDCPSASEATLKDMDKHTIWTSKNWKYNPNKTKTITKPCACSMGYTAYHLYSRQTSLIVDHLE